MANSAIMLSGTPNSGSTIHGFRIKTEFSWASYSPGKTLVSWGFYTALQANEGEEKYLASNTKARVQIQLNFTATQGSISELTGNTYDSGSSSSTYKQFMVSTSNKTEYRQLLSSGSFIITHDGNGKAAFTIGITQLAIGGYSVKGSTTIPTCVLETNYHYTNCSAPTSVTASGIIKPSGSFTVQWSGASGGASNSITGYDIYYLISSNGAAPTTANYTGMKTVTSTNTSGSLTIQVSNATRGYKVVCAIRTKGQAGSSYYSSLKTGGLVTINSVPSAPVVAANQTTLPSIGGSVTFTFSPGSDIDASQSKSVYYSTSSSGTKTLASSPLTINSIKTNRTYYFWTYDGLEYSSVSTISITINTTTTLTVSITGTTLATANGKSGYPYIVSPTINVTDSSPKSNKRYTYYLKYGTTTACSSGTKEIFSLDAAKVKSITDVRNYNIGHETSGLYYKFLVKCWDGIEWSSDYSSSVYYITKVPTLTKICNGEGYSNISGYYSSNMATHYSKYLGFVFQQDAGYNRLSFTDHNGSIQTINLSTDTLTQGSFNSGENINASKNHNLNYQIGYSSGYKAPSTSKTIIKIATPMLNNLNFNIGNFKYFTSSQTFTGTVGHNLMVSLTSTTALKNFGISSFSKAFKFLVEANAKTSTKNTITINSSGSTNTSQVEFSISALNLANCIDNSNLITSTERNKQFPAKMIVDITNDFGESTQLVSSFTIDYVENDEIKFSLEQFRTKIGTSYYTLSSWNYLKEGIGDIYANFKITSYNKPATGIVQMKRSFENIWQDIKTFTFGSATASRLSPATYTISQFVVLTIGEISYPKYSIDFRVKVITDAGEKILDTSSINIPVRGHTKNITNIKSSSYNKDTQQLTVDYEVIDWGADIENLSFNSTVTLYSGSSKLESTYKDTNPSTQTTTKRAIFENFIFPDNAESILLKIGIETTLSTTLKTNSTVRYTTTKGTDLTLEGSPVFNIVPTVSYRKNYLGINTLSIDNEDKANAVIVIGETTNRNQIVFTSPSSHLCQVINFHIDGGTW